MVNNSRIPMKRQKWKMRKGMADNQQRSSVQGRGKEENKQ